MVLPPLAREMLQLLLDRYERPHRDPKRVVRVWVKKDVPDYAAGARHEVNAALRGLEQQAAVKLHWVKYETNNWLAKVDLQPDQVALVYAALHRTPRRSQEAEFQALLAAQTPQAAWHAELLTWLNTQLSAKRSLAPFKLADLRFSTDLLAALGALAQLQAPTLERLFSVAVFGHSKRFTALRPAVLALLRRHSPHVADYGNDKQGQRALLRAHYLNRNPEYLPVSGPLTLMVNGAALDLLPFQPSVGLSAETLQLATAIASPVRKVLTIENVASFHHWLTLCPADTVTIFIGGFASPTAICLLKMLQASSPARLFYHWGDLDAGGWRILAHLRRQLGTVQTMAMDQATFAAHRQFAQPLTKNDHAALTSLQQHPLLTDCASTIAALLTANKKLEQEAIGAQYVLSLMAGVKTTPMADGGW